MGVSGKNHEDSFKGKEDNTDWRLNILKMNLILQVQ